MKYYWIASTIEIKTQATKNTLCACKMREEGNTPLNNVNVGKEFPIVAVEMKVMRICLDYN